MAAREPWRQTGGTRWTSPLAAIAGVAAVPAPWPVATSVLRAVAAWLAALRTRPPRGGRATLALTTVAAAVAWTYEATLNDRLVTLR